MIHGAVTITTELYCYGVSYYKSVGLATEGAGIRAGCLHGWAVVGHGGERRLLLRGHGDDRSPPRAHKWSPPAPEVFRG